MDTQQYILINKELKKQGITSGKLYVQLMHASSRFERAVAQDEALPLFNRSTYQNWVEDIEKKIVVTAKSSLLEKLESEGWITVRDAGLNELEPNTLTVVISPPLLKNEAPRWLSRLQLYKE